MNESELLNVSELGQPELKVAIGDLLNEAWSDDKPDRRADERHPFFRPVSIQMEADPRRLVSAFAREVSNSGIGLLHSQHVDLGPATLTISRPNGGSLRVKAELLWCRPCGEGWYLSGGRFTEIVSF